MRLTLALLLCLAIPLTAHARWQVKSEFKLHITEPLFDTVIADFWQSLQGAQTVPVGNVAFNAGSNTSVQINGINVNVDYSFPVPSRVSPDRREWELKSERIAARITADQLLVRQVIIKEINGIIFETVATAECRNISLVLPQGSASISARVRAEVVSSQVQLTMPHYEAHWNDTAWQVESLNCPQLAGIQGLIKEEIVRFLSSFDNLEHEVSAAIHTQFAQWSKDASMLLLSQLELPVKSDYIKVFYEPKEASENKEGRGLLLSGTLRLDYPFVAPGEDYSQEFRLPDGLAPGDQSSPQLLIPFATIRALIMGEYFANQLEYTMKSTEIPAFQSLMQSRFKQFFAWPDLMTYDKETTFLFQFLPLGPPSFSSEKSGGAGVIAGDLTIPLSMRMFAPLKGMWTPYVEFRTLVSGSTTMSLSRDGKVLFRIAASDQPAAYAFAQKYVQEYQPNQKIAIDTMAGAVRDSLNADGMTMSLPTLTVGKQLQLVPQVWNLMGQGVLKLDFNAVSKAAAAVQTQTARTANNKTLTVTSSTSSRSKKR